MFAATAYPEFFTTLHRVGPGGDPAAGWSAAGRDLVPGVTILEHNTIDPIALTPDGDGGVFILTAEQLPYNGHGGFLFPVQFFVHRRTASGDPAPGWTPQGVLVARPVIDHTFEVRHLPTMVPDDKGGVLVAWAYHLATEFPNPPLYAQRIRGDGARAWGDDGISVHSGPGACTSPTVVADGCGGGLVFWGQWDAPRTSVRVFGQHLTADGDPLWTRDGLAISSGAFTSLEQAMPADGGWVRQFYTPAIAAVPDGEGGAVLGWAASTGTGLDVRATRVAPDGLMPWQSDRLLCGAPGEQASVACVGLGSRGVVFVWRDGRASTDVSLRAQFISRQGRTHWMRDGAPVADGPGDRGPVVLGDDGREGFYFAWRDPRLGGQVFAQHLLGSGRPAQGWARSGSLVSTQATGDPNTGTLALGLARSTRGSNIVVWSDATAGSLASLLTPAGPVASTRTPTSLGGLSEWSSAPPAPTFGRLDVKPNPLSNSSTLRFELPVSGSAALELFDTAGRRVWSREVGELAAGEHVVLLADSAQLPAGFYLLRLTQGTRAATCRVVVLP